MATTNIQSFAGQVEVSSNLTVDTSTFHVNSQTNSVGLGTTLPLSTLHVVGNVYATSNVIFSDSTASSSKTTGALKVTGGVGISGALYGAAATFDGVTSVTNASASNSKTTGALQVTGGVGISGALYGANANLEDLEADSVNITDNTVSNSKTTGALKVTGGVGISGALYGANANLEDLEADSVNITDNTVSNSKTTGALKVTGGVGISGALYGANANLEDLEADSVNITDNTVSNSKTTGALKVTGGVGISGALYGAAATFDGAVSTGALTASSNVAVDTDVLFVDTISNNVGMGTTLPLYKLDVHGTSNVGALTATTGTFNTSISAISTTDDITILAKAPDSKVATIAAYGDSQGTGRLFVGQSTAYGGGIEYNGDNVPTSTGAGADYITLYRVDNSTYEWTARNSYNNNDWEFRSGLSASRLYTNDYMTHSGDTNTYIGFPDVDTFTVTTSGSERLRVNSSGNVGINKNPGSTLDISCGSSAVIIQGPSQGNTAGTNNDPWSGLRFFREGILNETYNGYVNLRTYRWATSGADPAMALTFNLSSTQPNNTADVMTLRSDGKVGIGTTTPKQAFEVVSSSYALISGRLGVGNVLTSAQNGGAQDHWNAGTSAQLVIRCTNSAYPAASYANARTYAGLAFVPGFDALDTTNMGLWGNGSGENPVFYIQNQVNSGTSGGGTVALQPVGGSVGIGTSNPGAKVDIIDSIFSTTNKTLILENPYPFGFNTGNDIGTSIVFRSRWQGDGISAPVDMCTIEGRKEASANYGDSYIRFSTRYETNRSLGGAGTLTEKMRIAGNGNVGIGTTSPAKTFHVAGQSIFSTNISTQNAARVYDADVSIVKEIAYGASGTVDLDIGATSSAMGNFTAPYRYKLYTDVANFDSKFKIAKVSGPDGTYNGYGTTTDILTINSNGNIGIGTTSPSNTLHVHQSVSGVTPILRVQATDSGRAAYAAYLNSSGTAAYCGLDGAGLFEHSTGALTLGTNDTPIIFSPYYSTGMKAIMTTSGYVGIGTASPNAPIDVRIGNGGGVLFASQWLWYRTTPNINATPEAETYPATQLPGGAAVSIYSTHAIGTQTYIFSQGAGMNASDIRIKKNIIDAADDECLEVIRKLKPKKYQYKDTVMRGNEPVWGFIAQEVRDTLSYATATRTDFLPNIYEIANVSQSNVITFVNFNTSNLESNATTLIRINDINNNQREVNLVEIIDEHSIRVREDLSEWTGSVDETGNVIVETTTITITKEEYEALDDKVGYSETNEGYTKTVTTHPGNQLFVYGQQVDDFIYVRKDAIWTVATSALQEVDRQLQAEKAKVATLETQLASVLTRLDALEST